MRPRYHPRVTKRKHALGLDSKLRGLTKTKFRDVTFLQRDCQLNRSDRRAY